MVRGVLQARIEEPGAVRADSFARREVEQSRDGIMRRAVARRVW